MRSWKQFSPFRKFVVYPPGKIDLFLKSFPPRKIDLSLNKICDNTGLHWAVFSHILCIMFLNFFLSPRKMSFKCSARKWDAFLKKSFCSARETDVFYKKKVSSAEMGFFHSPRK